MEQELFNYAKRIAFKIWKDPEAEDAALNATMRCINTFDETKNVPIKRWLARLVKQSIIHRWRAKRAAEFKVDWWWETVVEIKPIECQDSTEDYVLLYESYVDKWPLDVIARRRGWSIAETRKHLAAAKARFVRSMESEHV